MHHAATCAGLGFGNAMASAAHAMGHALGAAFDVPHGRAVGLFLPGTIEFAARAASERFADLGRVLGLTNAAGEAAARDLAHAIRSLACEIGSPVSVADLGVDRGVFEAQVEALMDNAFNDTQMITAPRSPSYDELRELFLYAYDGAEVDF
jgi:alcohol dehydrogenase class IV